MYVAITRAKRRLYLSYAAVRFINGQRQDEMPSSFLDEIPQEHLEWLADPQAASRESWASSSGSWGRGGDEPHRGRASYGHWGERRSDSESRGSGDRGTFTGNAYTWSPKGKDASYNAQAGCLSRSFRKAYSNALCKRLCRYRPARKAG